MPRGGARAGAGRPKGSKNADTLAREAIQAAVAARIWSLADRLVSAQLAAAEGVTFLFKRAKTGGPVVRVTSEDEIRRFLDTHGPQEEVQEGDNTFYFLAAERPNADAADRLLNRGMGKPVDQIALSGPDGKALTVPSAVTFVVRVQE